MRVFMPQMLVLVGLLGCDQVFGLHSRDVVPATSARSVSAGRSHTCANRANDNTIRCWGDGTDGRLGYGSTETIGDDETAGSRGDLEISDKVVLALGGSHTCALRPSDGSVRCWGDNDNGRLGYANTVPLADNELLSSVENIQLGAEATQIAAGSAHTCALVSGGGVECWGAGSNGRLGYATIEDTGDNEHPSAGGQVVLNGAATALATGGAHTCAVLESIGRVQCWGLNVYGQLGLGNTSTVGDNETPATAGSINFGLASKVERITAGENHTCVLMESGDVRCWGQGDQGQLGYGNIQTIGDETNEVTQTAPVVIGGAVLELVAGAHHTCVLLATKSVRCWGRGTEGQLGYGDTQNIGDNETLASVGDVPLGEDAIGVTAGGAHTCAVLASGAVKCWGLAASGQLGYGTTENIGDDETPESVGSVPVFDSP